MNRPKYPSPAVDLTSYQLLVESVKDYAIFMLDPAGHIITWNIGAERIKGYTPEEAIGQHFSMFYPSEDLQAGKPDRALQVAIKEGKYEEEGWRIRKDGSRFWASVVITALFGPEGELTGFAKVTRDMTEHKRHEETLKEANARLQEQVEERTAQLFAEKELAQATLHSTGDAVITVNVNGFVDYLNPIAEQLSGWTTREARGYSILDVLKIVDATTRQPMLNPVEQALQEGRIVELANNALLLSRNGREIDIEDSAAPIHAQDGRLIGAVMVFHDITRRKNAERILRQNEKTFRATFEHAPLGLCHIALDGTVLMANKALADMFGYTMREVYGLKPQEVVHPDDLPGDVEGAQKLLSGKVTVFQREKRHIRKDRSICWSIVSSTLMRDERGEPSYIIVSVEDITARKEAEHAREDYAEQFAATFDLAPVGITHTALDGRLIQVNQAFCRMTGYTREELAHLTFEEISHPDDAVPQQSSYQQLFSGEAQTISLEKRYVRKDGGVVWAHITGTLKRNVETGAPEYFIAIAEVISKRKKTEEALRESEARYRATYEHAPVGIAHTDLAGHWQQVNDRLCQILGYSREDLLRMSFQEITHPDDLPSQLDAVRRLLSGEMETYTMEKRYLRKDGSIVWAVLTGSVIRDDSGQTSYFIAVVEDITARKQAEEAQQSSEEQFRTIFEHAAEGIAQLDLAGNFQRVNAAMCQMHGYTKAELEGFNLRNLTSPEDRALAEARFQELLSGTGRAVRLEKRNIRKNRTRVWVDVNLSLVRDAAGKPRYAIAMVEDITWRKRAEEAMRRAEEHFRLLVEGAEDYAIIRLDEYGNIASWNSGAENILGYQEEEIIGQHFSHFYTPEDVERGEPQRKLSSAIREGRAEDDRWRARKDGSRFWGSSVINALYDDEGSVRGFVKVMRDVSEQRLHQERAAFLANHDTLTGLPNRAYFSDRLHEAVARAQREGSSVALHLLDLDRFKAVNDTLGHHVGDLLLKEVANRLQTCVRETDTVARLGGDEFVVIQTQVTREEDAAFLAQKIVDALEEPYDLEGQEVHSGTSVGVTIYPQDAQDSVQLLKNADLALYRAKDHGRHNYQFFTADLHAVILSRQQMEQDLRRALANQEFSLYYQPQIDLDTWKVCGVEALLRWRNPQLRMLAPGDFMEIAQETGLIVPIGEWVLREACQQNKAWQDAGIPFFRVGVNFSARQIHDPKFVGMIKRVLAETGLSPTCLEIEISEGQFVKDREATQAILEELTSMDIRVSTDDFGAALSNLNLLCQFPMDTLKIDRRVIEHVAHRRQDRAMAAAVINLAKDLEVRVVAEGVETMEQLAFLQEKGCQAAQGFLFSPPVSARSLEALLRAGTWSRMNPPDDEEKP